ncbi:hypothetical protein, partial [Escherichia coli]
MPQLSSDTDWGRFADHFFESELSDSNEENLFAWGANIVASPRKTLESFTMHAPLELMARFLLLPS